MATAQINDVQLFYEFNGMAELPLVLVHGTWTSHHTWDRVASRLAESFRVLTYDRRGHSQSERPTGQGSIREDVADLAALIEHLGIAPAWVAGSSAGAGIALRLAADRPELLRGAIGHEPQFFSLLSDDPDYTPVLDGIDRLNRAVVERIAAGAHEDAAQYFIDTLMGSGSWAKMPREFQQTLIYNAPTVEDDLNDPEHFVFDLESIKEFSQPVLLTVGDQSPPMFAPVIALLAEALPHAEVFTFEGAGHTPYSTHADGYVELLTAFIRKHSD